MKIAVLHDQLSEDSRPDEVDVLAQAEAVSAALQSLGHSPFTMDVTLDLGALADALARRKPDLVFNLVESLNGQGRLIPVVPALLETLAVPYTGAPADAIFITSQKVLTKRLLAANEAPTPPWLEMGVAAEPELPLPDRYIVKSVWEEASLGLDDESVVSCATAADLRAEVAARAAALGGEAFAERYIEGREFNLSVLAGRDGPEVLPPAEIDFLGFPARKPRIVGYAAKWDTESFEYQATVRRLEFPADDEPMLARLKRIAADCWRLFGLRGYARVDLRVDAEGEPWVLEVNANPCLSPDAGFVAAAERGGLTMADVVARIVADANGPRAAAERWGEQSS